MSKGLLYLWLLPLAAMKVSGGLYPGVASVKAVGSSHNQANMHANEKSVS